MISFCMRLKKDRHTFVTLSGDSSRIYFDSVSRFVDDKGPELDLFLDSERCVPFYLSIWGDRDGEDEVLSLNVYFGANKLVEKFPIYIIDKDPNIFPRPTAFPYVVDFSYDKTGFFDENVGAKACVDRALSDWLYFMDPAGLEPVSRRDSEIYVFPTSGWSGRGGTYVKNDAAYTGYRLLAYGVAQQGPVELRRSGGYGAQTVQTSRAPTVNGGAVAVEVSGNYNGLGYANIYPPLESRWFVESQHTEQKPNDFYSIMLHEIGHALAFSRETGGAKTAVDRGSLVVDGVSFPFTAHYHFTGDQAVDRMSGYGMFGQTSLGTTVVRRWLPTRMDLLAMQALGWTLRPGLFPSAQFVTAALPLARVQEPYAVNLLAVNATVPVYRFSLVNESVAPAGLVVDAFTGLLSGTPTSPGVFQFTVMLETTKAATTTTTDVADAEKDASASVVMASFTVSVVDPQTDLFKGQVLHEATVDAAGHLALVDPGLIVVSAIAVVCAVFLVLLCCIGLMYYKRVHSLSSSSKKLESGGGGGGGRSTRRSSRARSRSNRRSLHLPYE